MATYVQGLRSPDSAGIDVVHEGGSIVQHGQVLVHLFIALGMFKRQTKGGVLSHPNASFRCPFSTPPCPLAFKGGLPRPLGLV